MIKFTFYVEGVNIDVMATAATEREAHRLAFASLTDAQKDACVCLDCVDEQPLEQSCPTSS